MPRTRAKKGSWVGVCEVCRFKFHASDLKKRWDGLYVCNKDFELRHPSDFFRMTPDDQSVAFTSPESTDTEIDTSSWIDTSTEDPDRDGTNNGDL